MGSVFLARHKTLRRFCAIKVINLHISHDPDSTERFLREARATASFSHPNLVPVFDCDQFEGQSFIAMEYVEGMSLAEIIQARGALPIPLAFSWLIQAATALEYIHSKHVIHRDMKPDNMMIDMKGTLKIMDLGLAKDCLNSDFSMTVTGMIMGSPNYISPEQIKDSKTVDHRSDLYALGISFFQMLTGRVPFQHSSSSLICIAHLQEPVPSVNLHADLNMALDSLIGKMTAKDKNERFQSATEILDAIRPLAADHPIESSSEQFFSSLGVEDRRVVRVLEKNSIAEKEVDGDFTQAPSTPEPSSQIPTIAPAGHPFNAPTPHLSAKRPRLGWTVFGLASCILILIGWKLWIHSGNPAPGKEIPFVSQKSESPKVQPSAASLPMPVAKLGGLYVRTEPEQAMVMFGARSQSSPATFPEVPVGKYTVQISLDGYQNVEKEVTIEEDHFAQLNVSLTPVAKKEAKPQLSTAGGVHSKTQDPVSQWVERLDKAMQADYNQWPMTRQQILAGVANHLNQKGVQGTHANLAVTDIGKILDEARGSSPDVYNAGKQKMARDIYWRIREAVASGQRG